MARKILIIGGVAAGASAAAKARRDDEKAEITIYEKGPYISFANCGLPYYLGRDIKKRDDLFLMTPEFFYQRYRVNVKVNHEVVEINKEEKSIAVKNLVTGEAFKDYYDKLVITTGGTPIKPSIAGINLENIFTLFTINDVDAIEKALNEENIEKVAVVGGGYIGLEATEAFLKRGKKVTLIEKMNQLLPYLDEEMAQPLAKHLENLGVRVILGNGVKEFRGETKVREVVLENDDVVEAQLVIVAIGARPQLELIKKAGLEIGGAGGVVVDATLRTSDPHIYAGGDIIETVHLVTGKKVRIPLAGPANKQGRVIGANVVGGHKYFKGVLGTSIVKVGDLTAAKTGIGEREAKELGLAYLVSYTPALHHAGYYPNARYLVTKLIFAQHSGKILGAQIVGWEGVDKRIDVLATAIHGSMTVEDLENLDLAYAPPYSSAKDPVIMAGFVAANVLRGEIDLVTPESVKKSLHRIIDDRWQIVDVRTHKEREKEGYIPGALFIPVDQLRERYGELDPNRKTLLYCKSGYRSYLGYKILKDLGFKDVYSVSGGYMGYRYEV
ncbi:MAG: FAD-dependent oxidoreductase [Clostridia bacterium]|nr:FAD-dependent oxidoreductase [Clostridia bacterium]